MRRALFLYLLAFTEYLYLRSSGWRRERKNRYLAPTKYQFKDKSPYSRGHAVNAQKQLDFNPMHGGKRAG
jgi:hypothetical protein